MALLVGSTPVSAAPVSQLAPSATTGPTYLTDFAQYHPSSIAAAPRGEVSVLGTVGPEFAPTPGAHHDQDGDLALQRLDPAGRTLWAARIGGSAVEYPHVQEVDSNGDVYLAGLTRSRDFPSTAGALGANYWDESRDRVNYLAKVSAEGRLLWAARVPGVRWITGIDVDGGGAVYLSGQAYPEFAASPDAFDDARAGASEGFVLKVSPHGSRIVWASFIGGSSDDSASDVAVARDGRVAVTGSTYSTDFETTPGSALPSSPADVPNNSDGFVLELEPDGRSAAWSTYLGAAANEHYGELVLADDGRVDVVGWVEGYDGPRVPGEPSPGGLLAQLTADGSELERIETALIGTGNPTPDGEIIGIGHVSGGGPADDMVVRMGFDGAVVSASPLPYYGVVAGGDAVSTYVVLEERPSDRPAARTATVARRAVARYAPCTIRGTRGRDVLRGTRGPDVICGLGGHDLVVGAGSWDVVRGGGGRDRLYGGPGVDVLVGGPGRDLIVGGSNNDLLKGGSGTDRLFGRRGADRLAGGPRADLLSGGPGRDLCTDRRGDNAVRSCRA